MTCPTGTCGVGGWGGPLPGDPSNNAILSAVTAFGGIDVSWSYPTTNPHAVAYTKLYRSLTSNFAGAVLRAEVGGAFFYDKLDNSNTYYYWIQIVSANGTVGELIGPASAAASPTIEQTMQQLTGLIDSGLLAISLRNEIDQISILNTNLADEITDRETGETTLSEAMADVADGLAEAHTFIINEANTRAENDSAIAEQIDGVVATLGDDIAAVTVAMSVEIDAVNDTVDALYVAKLTVNDLVGGFGLHNDGDVVEAGFDVDFFWVGRTNADKIKPFIIDDDVVYIDEAAINKLTFSKLRDEAGAFVVEDGKVRADLLETTGLSVRGEILGGDYTEYETLTTGLNGFYLGPAGFIVGNETDDRFFKVDVASGDIYAPQFSIVDGEATFSGTVAVGSSPVIVGTTMTGTGVVLNPDGTLAAGTAASNMVFNGTSLYLNNILLDAITATIASGSLSVSVGSGIQAYGSRTVSVSGGRSTYSYLWFVAPSGGDRVFITGGQGTTTVSISGNANGVTNTADIVCLVKDSNSRVTFVSFAVSAVHEYTEPSGGGE